MNILKKYLSILLSAVMALNMLSAGALTAFAEGGNAAKVETGGETGYYDTLESAFAAADGKTATITLLNDVTVTEELRINNWDSDITLDCGGFTLTSSGWNGIATEANNLTVKNGKIKYLGRQAAINLGTDLNNGGTKLHVMSDAVIDAVTTNGKGIAGARKATVNIYGTVLGNDYAVRPYTCKLNVYPGAVISGEESGIILSGGIDQSTVNLYGGTIAGKKNNAIDIEANASPTIIVADSMTAMMNDTELDSITESTGAGTLKLICKEPHDFNGVEPDEDYFFFCDICRQKFAAVAKVETNGTVNYYATVEDAWEAAKNSNSTVTLLADAEVSETLEVPENIEITLNCTGYTLTGTYGRTIDVYGTLNFIGGTLCNTYKYDGIYFGRCIYLINNSTFTMNGGKLTAGGANSFRSSSVHCSGNGMTITIKDGILENDVYAPLNSNVSLSGGTYFYITCAYVDGKRLSQFPAEGYAFYRNGKPLTPTDIDSSYCLYNVTVQKCDHSAASYESDGNGQHIISCSFCGNTTENCTYGTEYTANEDNTKHIQTCTLCEYEKSEAHSGGTASCIQKAVCEICGQEYGEFAAHSLTKTDAVLPTCSKEGNDEYWTCSVCGKMYSDENGTEELTEIPVVPATPHTETEIPAVDPTCTAAGSAAGVECSVCGTVLTAPEIIPALGHKYGMDWTSDVLNHWHECSVCGDKTNIAAHTPDSGTVTVRPTTEAAGLRVYACTECGAKISEEEIPVLGPDHVHDYGTDWKFNSESHWHECICGVTSENSAHIWDGGVPVTAPTCTEAGVMTYSCTACGITKTEPVNALGHSFTNYISNNDATCTEDGTETAVCERCPETVTRTAAGSKKGHAEDGGTITKQPTETEAGVKTFRCTVCGAETRRETISPIAAEHTHVYGTTWIYDTANHWHECVCGEKADTANHTSDGGTVTKQPTSTETGVKTFKCTVCGYLMNTEIIPATGIPTAPVIPPSVPSIPSNPTTAYQTTSKEPYISGASGKTGWDAIADYIISTPDGGKVTVQMNGTTKLPQNIISQIQDRDIDLVLEMGGGFVWTINGLSVTKARTVDMGVRKKPGIPQNAITEFFGDVTAVQLDLRHSGDFGFTAELTVDIGNRYSGMYANSYCYKSGTFEFGDSAEIVNGKATLRFTHASKWLITVGDFPAVEDVSSAAAAHSDGEPIDMSDSTRGGITIPEFDERKRLSLSNRNRILKKRKLYDLVFVL